MICSFWKIRQKFFNKIKRRVIGVPERERERGRGGTPSGTFERTLLFGPGSRDPKPLSADILSARKYNRPSEKLTGRGPVTRHFFNLRELLFVRSFHFCSSVQFLLRSPSPPPAGMAIRFDGYVYICIYIVPASVRHAKRPPGNFYSSDPGRALLVRATRSSGQTEI